MNLMRFARSISSVGQAVPARFQSDTPTSAVAIVRSIAIMITAYNAKLRCAEHAWRTKTKLACISIATMIGPVTYRVVVERVEKEFSVCVNPAPVDHITAGNTLR